MGGFGLNLPRQWDMVEQLAAETDVPDGHSDDVITLEPAEEKLVFNAMTPEKKREMALTAVQQLQELKRNKQMLVEQLLADKSEAIETCKQKVAEITQALHDLGWRRPKASVDPARVRPVKKRAKTRRVVPAS